MKMKSILHPLCLFALLVGLFFTPWVSLAAPNVGSVSGAVTYSGSHDTNHQVLVAAHVDVHQGPVTGVEISGPGSYTLSSVPDGSYYISAFLDIHDTGEGPPETGEPKGWYDADGDGAPDPVTVSGGSLTGIDIELEDVTTEYIGGTACYYGDAHGGRIEIGLHAVVGQEPVVNQFMTERPCMDYMFNGGPSGTYYMSLFYDLNGSGGPPDPGEPVAWYDGDGDGEADPIIYSGDVITGIDITLGTPPVPATILYVDFAAEGSADGTSWEDAYTDLQGALTAADAGDEIWVASGLYTPGTTRASTFALQSGVAVYGGFNGTETDRTQRHPRTNVTVLSGEVGTGSPTDNVYHVVSAISTTEDPITETTVLDGFVITGGYADGWGVNEDQGGGLFNQIGSPTLANLNFVGNHAIDHGGGLCASGNADPLTVVNSTFSGNSTTYNGGAIANISGSVVVANSSLIGNTGGSGGGIVGLQGGHTEVKNSILWGNQGHEIGLQLGATAGATYSIIEGGFAGGTNILTGDPLFVDADGADNTYGTLDDDLHLQSTSPAIDAGDVGALLPDTADSDGDTDISETTPVDFEGRARQVDDPGTANTGSGAPPVDIGADEVAAPVEIGGLHAAAHEVTLLGDAAIFAARVISGTHVAYTWDFGDGSSDVGGAVAHAYTSAGVYQVTVTAANSLGSLQAGTTVTVSKDMAANPGSSVTTSDGVLTFDVPASLPAALTLSYTPQSAPGPAVTGDRAFAGVSFQLDAVDGSGSPITEPSQPLTLTVTYDERDLPDLVREETLQVYRYDDGTAQWVPLTLLSRDLVNDTITVSLDHFSEFALLGDSFSVYVPLVRR